MSRGPENTFIASIHRLLPKTVYSMKNHNEYNGGIADCWYDGPRADLWVEYKFITIPKRPSTLIAVELSDLQKQWLRNRWTNGRNVAVVVGCEEGGVWLEADSWLEDVTAEEFRRCLMTRQTIANRIKGYVLG